MGRKALWIHISFSTLIFKWIFCSSADSFLKAKIPDLKVCCWELLFTCDIARIPWSCVIVTYWEVYMIIHIRNHIVNLCSIINNQALRFNLSVFNFLLRVEVDTKIKYLIGNMANKQTAHNPYLGSFHLLGFPWWICFEYKAWRPGLE